MLLIDLVLLTLAFYGLVRLLVARIQEDRLSPRGLAAAIAVFLAAMPMVFAATGVLVAPWWEIVVISAALFVLGFILFLRRAPGVIQNVKRTDES